MSKQQIATSTISQSGGLIGALNGAPGFYVLTRYGQLGTYDRAHTFHVDSSLSARLSEHNVEYLAAYLRNPDAPGWRVGVIYNSRVQRPWGFETLALEDYIARTFYPVGGAPNDALTEFQKRNQHKSIYRGIELLVEHQSDAAPGAAIFCPVLFNRYTTLAQHAPLLNGQIEQEDLNAPVVEVINLAASIPVARRTTPEILEIKERMYQNLIDKGLRRAPALALVDDVGERRSNTQSVAANEVYAEVDKRSERPLTLPTGKSLGEFYGADVRAAALENLWRAEACQKIARYIETPYKFIDPAELKVFNRFRLLDSHALALLAATSPAYRAPGGSELFMRGSNDGWNLYLLEGMVELEAADGAKKTLEAGTPAAQSPISLLKPRKYTVTALSPVRFLWIHDTAVNDVSRGNLPSRYVF